MQVRYVTDRGSRDRLNEDFAGSVPDAGVVLDGAGSPEGVDSGCGHGVFWYVRELGTRLLGNLAEESDQDLKKSLAVAIDEVAALHADTCDLTNAATPSATVAAFRAAHGHLDFLVLCDATVLLDRHSGAEAISDRRVDVLPNWDFDTAYGRRNRAGGYWIAAADGSVANEAITGRIPLDELRGAALLTDGASRIADPFGLMSWQEVADLLEGDDGPTRLLDRVRAAEHTDLEGHRWPRSKIHDDATVLYAHLG